MAKLGVRKFQDLIGRTDFLAQRDGHHLKADLLDLNDMLKNALELRSGVNIHGGSVSQNFRLEARMENEVIEACRGVIDGTVDVVNLEYTIANNERTFGATLSYHIAKKYQVLFF